MSDSNLPCCPRVHANSHDATDSLNRALAKYSQLEPVDIDHHGEPCCDIAREWFRGISRARHEISGLPAPWLRDAWNWGPCPRPAYWCDVLERKNIDCNQLAALSVEGLHAVGRPAEMAQVVCTYDEESVANWTDYWRDHGGGYWMSGNTCYHEVIAVDSPNRNEIRIWDPTDEIFCEDRALTGHGSLAAVRICADADSPLCHEGAFSWRGHLIPPRTWTVIT